MKRKALRVRSEGSIPPYVTEAESRKQHSDSPLCNSLVKLVLDKLSNATFRHFNRLINIAPPERKRSAAQLQRSVPSIY